MKLIGALTSPYVRKVRIVMAEKKLDYQFVIEDVWNNDAIVASGVSISTGWVGMSRVSS